MRMLRGFSGVAVTPILSVVVACLVGCSGLERVDDTSFLLKDYAKMVGTAVPVEESSAKVEAPRTEDEIVEIAALNNPDLKASFIDWRETFY